MRVPLPVLLCSIAAAAIAVPTVAQIKQPAILATAPPRPVLKPATTPPPPAKAQPAPAPVPVPLTAVELNTAVVTAFGAAGLALTDQDTVGPGRLTGTGSRFYIYDADVGTAASGPYAQIQGHLSQWRIDYTSNGKPYMIDCAMTGAEIGANYAYGRVGAEQTPLGTGWGKLINGHLLAAVPADAVGQSVYVRFWADLLAPVQLHSCKIISVG